MSVHPIEGLMNTTMNSLKDMIDVNTIVGDPVQSPDGLIIIPISKVGFGFASGGTEFNINKKNDIDIQQDKLPFGGGSGAGVSLQPVAFIVVGNNQMKLLPVDENSSALNNLFDFMSKLANDLKETLNKKKNDENKAQTDTKINMDNIKE